MKNMEQNKPYLYLSFNVIFYLQGEGFLLLCWKKQACHNVSVKKPDIF